MKLKTIFIAGASIVALSTTAAFAGGDMNHKDGKRHSKQHGKHHGKHHGKGDSSDGINGKDGANSSAMWKSGFSLGVMAGWQNLQGKKTTIEEFATPTDLATPPFSIKKTKKGNGFVGGPSVGYNHVVKNFLIGLHTAGEWNSGKAKTNFINPANAHYPNVPGQLQLKKNWSWLLHAKFGYIMGTCVPYIKLGTALNGYKITETIPTQNYKATWKKTKLHFAPAVGMDHALNKNISVGFEGMYLVSGKVTTKTTQATKVRTKPNAWTVQATVAYRM